MPDQGELEVHEGIDGTPDGLAVEADREALDRARLPEAAEPLGRRGEAEVDLVGELGDRQAPVALAISTIVATDRAREAVAGIRRPARTMALMTMVNPLSLVAWAAVALALPSSLRSPAALAVFGTGLVLASAFWHSGLAVAAGSLAQRMGDGPRTVVTRVSGVVLLVVGGVLVA